jgi:hypothetical protein
MNQKEVSLFEERDARYAIANEDYSVAHRDFRFQGRAVFAGIEPRHTEVILFEREF